MIFENMKRLGVYPPAHCVKVGDTASDMQEGRNAGLICVGVCDSSSDAVIGGPENARRVLEESGAHRTIGTSPELWNILEEL
jgi:phosphonoacetaldehyde hydrolase